ncbi:RCC1 domain-containing protein [Paraherbaspirillum soli]|uniref:RCC1 domain-containing protein n=1 Tax=Paraherbaspirillum soli TaxID=631222 RepID=A0ABW0MB41_9BURK
MTTVSPPILDSTLNLLTASSHALPAPQLPAAYNGVGLGWDHLLDSKCPVIVLVSYPNMLSSEVVYLYWNDELVQTLPGREDGGVLAFEVLPMQIPDGPAQVRYVVHDSIRQTDTTSSSLSLVVKRSLPGGVIPGPLGDINHYLAVPAGLPALITPELAAKGIPVQIASYLNMAEGDTIQLSWHGHLPRLTHTVERDEVGRAMTIEVPEAVILAVGDTTDLAVRYEIRDQANNWSGWSQHATGAVEIDCNALAPPRVVDAIDGVIDVHGLNGKNVTVRIPAYADVAKGDLIALTWAGQTAGGSAVAPAVVEHTVTQDDVEFGVAPLSIAYAYVADTAQGQATVHYSVKRYGAPERTSGRVLVRTVDPTCRLAPPRVLEAVDGELDPSRVPAVGATVEIDAYAGMAAGDVVRLNWLGRAADHVAYPIDESKFIYGSTVGLPVYFVVPKDQVERLAGGSLTVSYTVITCTNAELTSPELKLQVKAAEAQALLPLPTVDGAVDGVLDPYNVPNGTTLRIPASAHTRAGETVRVFWTGRTNNIGVDSFTDCFPVSAGTAGKELPFPVALKYITANIGTEVTVRYQLELGHKVCSSPVLSLYIGYVATMPLPAPSIDEARGDKLDPADTPFGATVRIGAGAHLKTGDKVVVYWKGTPGPGTTSVHHTVTRDEAGLALKLIVPAKVVQADDGHTITLDYTVKRGNNPIQTSFPAAYDVGSYLGAGQLLVMGARSSAPGFAFLPGSKQQLTAFDARTRLPVAAFWKYAGEPGEPGEYHGSTFRDTQPARPLHVRLGAGRVTVNPKNLTGTGNGSADAFVARLDRGDLVAWGTVGYGGKLDPSISTMTDIVEAVGNGYAFAARRNNGSVVAWGLATAGGNTDTGTSVSKLTDIVEVVGNPQAFAARRANGSVVAWGAAGYGGNPDTSISNLTDIVEVVGNGFAFAARRANGSVVAWGHATYGGKPDTSISDLTDIVEVVGNGFAFAARRANGSVVAWGEATYGGKPGTSISNLTDIVEVAGNGGAFAARRANGSVVVWGHDSYGGKIDTSISNLTDIVDVVGNVFAFAARRANGTVVAWGNTGYGGDLGSTIPTMTDIVQVVGNGYAFAALRANGTVVAWGGAVYGGTIPRAIVEQLKNVRAVYANSVAFVALTDDKRIVTWGVDGSGGNSGSVSGQIDGQISYEATPASRCIRHQFAAIGAEVGAEVSTEVVEIA